MADLRSDAAREVSKTTKTLMQEILDQKIAKPELMGFNAWQKWRRGAGKRPTRAADGKSTTPREEADLFWRTMSSLYGESWREDLALTEAEEENEDGAAEENPAAERKPAPQGALGGLPPGPPAVPQGAPSGIPQGLPAVERSRQQLRSSILDANGAPGRCPKGSRFDKKGEDRFHPAQQGCTGKRSSALL